MKLMTLAGTVCHRKTNHLIEAVSQDILGRSCWGERWRLRYFGRVWLGKAVGELVTGKEGDLGLVPTQFATLLKSLIRKELTRQAKLAKYSRNPSF